MIRYAIVFLLFSFPVMASSNLSHGGTPVPAAAGAVGYTVNTFHVGPFTTSNVDTAQTYAPGFLLYENNLAGSSSNPANFIINSDGTMTILNEATLVSAGGILGFPFYHGNAFGCGYYQTAEISFDPNPPGRTGVGYPAFWSMALENLVGSHNNPPSAQWPGQPNEYVHYSEFDIFEFDRSNSYPNYAYGGTIVDWYGQYNVTCPGFCGVLSSFAPNTIIPPKSTDWTLWHRIAGLWVPATDITVGYVQYYFDDIPMRFPLVTWTKYDGNVDTPPPTTSSPWLFGVIDIDHMLVIIGGGGGAGNWTMNVRSVDVWQGPGSCNISN